MTTLNGQQRASLLDRLFRRIGNLDDDTLVHLDNLTRAVDEGGVVTLPSEPRVSEGERLSRRYFLASLLAGGLLMGGAAGASVVALNDEGVRQWLGDAGVLPTETAQPATATPGPSPSPTLPNEAVSQISGLQRQVTQLTGQRDALLKQVSDAQANATNLQLSNEAAKALLDLYKQLEGINIDQVVTAAIAALALPLEAVDTIQAALGDGVVLASKAIQGVENEMPIIAAGLDWLEQQVGQLIVDIRAFQTALKVSNAQDVSNFITNLLGMLPFGVGDDVKTTLQAMGTVMNALPMLLDNVDVRVIEPARTWAVADKQGGLYASLLNPMQSQLVTPAQQMVANAQNLNSLYNSNLAQPGQAALDQRNKIRALIAQKAGTSSQ